MKALRRAAAVPLLPLVAALATGCGDAEVRPQIVLVVDTDLPVSSQLFTTPEWSDIAVDTVRVDILYDDEAIPPRELVLPDANDWPFSFGLVPGEHDHVRIRLRAFQAARAEVGELDGLPTLEPRPPVTVDRLVDLVFPPSGVALAHVVLSGDCLGVRARFGSSPATCIDAERLEAPPHEGAHAGTPSASLVGSWPAAAVVDCKRDAAEGEACIRGGISVLGDHGLANAPKEVVAPIPLRPVRLSPFFMARTEMTVGRYRQLLAEGRVTELPVARDLGHPLHRYCTWLGPDDGTHDELPLNCVTFALAEAACIADDGRLPSEAEWEHAARGRGRGHRYPWGDAAPDCCFTGAGVGYCYPVVLPDPVGSHLPSEDCSGDVTGDGVLDLGGSLQELTRDGFASYEAACWQGPGALLDPVCFDASLPNRSLRGGHYFGALLFTAAALRANASGDPAITEGFRCVREDAP